MDSFTRELAIDGGRVRLDTIAGELARIHQTLPELRPEVERRLRVVLTARVPKADALKAAAKAAPTRAAKKAPRAKKRPGWSAERRAKMMKMYADRAAAKKAHAMLPVVSRRRTPGARKVAAART